MDDIRALLLRIITGFDLGIEHGSLAYEMLVLGIVVVFLVIVDFILRLIFIKGLRGLLGKIPWFNSSTADARSNKVLSKLVSLIVSSLFIGLLTLPFPNGGAWYVGLLLVARLCQTFFFFSLLTAIIDTGRAWMLKQPQYRDNPMVALLQAFKVLAIFLAVLVVISLLFRIDMSTIFGSLAALSAVLMLIFKDTILGFVASIQLTGSDMVHVGDWITVPGKSVDGNVVEISLTTVKVMGFDNSMYTIPPYDLVSNPVQNWSNMQRSNARLCARSIYIDISSIRYADDQLIKRLRQSGLLSQVMDQLIAEVEDENKKQSLTDDLTRVRVTNLGLFRNYVLKFLEQSDAVDHNYDAMCFQKPMTEMGLPLLVRFFTKTSNWGMHETIAANTFEHLMAVISLFDLKIYQKVSSSNLASATESELKEMLATKQAAADSDTEEAK